MAEEYKICQLYCDHCNWKLNTNNMDDLRNLHEIKSTPIPGGSPKYNQKEKKIDVPKSIIQKKKFRCPKCGYAITPKMVNDVQKQIESKIELEKRIAERKKLEQSIMDHSRRKHEDRLDRTDGSETSPERSPLSGQSPD